MLRSLLIGLDGSRDGESVVELGLRWAKRRDAPAVGVAVVDQPGILASAAVLFEGAHDWRDIDATAPRLANSRRGAELLLRQFVKRCDEAGVTSKTLDDVGTPFVQILMEAQCYDLVMLGQQTHFDYGREGEPDETLVKVLEDSPRPVVAVPKSILGGDAVVIAYDGSLQASRALYAFEASGLGVSREVHIVSVSADYKEAARHAGRALEFLRLHGIAAVIHPVGTSGSAADVILAKADELKAGLLVMGAYGQPVLREFFLGSVTRTVLRESRTPVFCYH